MITEKEDMDKDGDVNSRNDSIVMVEVGQMPVFEKRLAALNKKAISFGLEPIQIQKIEERSYGYRNTGGKFGETEGARILVPYEMLDTEERWATQIVKINVINLDYPVIRLGNWSVVGKLEVLNGENLTFTISPDPSDIAAVSERAEHPITCEHCKTKRNRNDGFILRNNESAKYTQVGSNCLKDFTGIDPAAALFIAKMSQLLGSCDDDFEEYRRSGRFNAVDAKDYLTSVAFAIDQWGFVSKTKAFDTGQSATYNDALRLGDILKKDDALRLKYWDKRESYWKKADEVITWVRGMEPKTDFDRNLKIILKSDVIDLDGKRLAIAAAAVPMYDRHLNKKVEQTLLPSEHVGKPGEKMDRELVIQAVVPIQTFYGLNHIVLMRDEKGNQFKWKTASAPDEVLDGKGHKFEATFKIKAHEEYKDVPQTAITHVKVVRWLDLDPAKQVVRISMYEHPTGTVDDFTRMLGGEEEMMLGELVNACRSYAWQPSTERAGGMNAWFLTKPDETGAVYSLHIHKFAGHEPGGEDYDAIGAMLDSLADQRPDAEADGDEEMPLPF